MSEFKPLNLFVYGTLQKNGWNNHLLKGAEFICEAITVDALPLVSGGIPFLFNEPGTGHQVSGEVWVVPTAQMLDRLDRLERHPQWYRRTPIKVTNQAGEVLEVEAYMLSAEERLNNPRYAKLPLVSKYVGR